MNKLTLTGATLLSDMPVTTPDVEAAATEMTAVSSSTHSHSHSHDHGGGSSCPRHAGKAASNKPVQFQLNIPQVLEKNDNALVVQTLFTIVRMGPFDLYHQLVTAWQAKLELISSNSTSNKSTTRTRNTTTSSTGATDTDTDTATTVESLLLNARDDRGHSLLHWAAKRTDETRFVRALLQIIPASIQTELDGMTPIHWACTEAHALPLLKLLLAQPQQPAAQHHQQQKQQPLNTTTTTTFNSLLLEVRDSTGCTPLLIAAQHGQVETAAWLSQKGANVDALDASRDSAVHWAAYKGSLSVLGMLTHKESGARLLEQADAYGQTPLHLAALRGHGDACRYILRQLLSSNDNLNTHHGGGNSDNKRRVLYLLDFPDKNSRTPYQLAVHKQQRSVAVLLQQYKAQLSQNRKQRIQSSILRNARQIVSYQAWKRWMGFSSDLLSGDESSSDDLIFTSSSSTAPQFPFYYVAAHILGNYLFYGIVYVPIFSPSAGVLWDCMLAHVVLLAMLTLGAYCFYKTYATDPGKVEALSSQSSRGGGGGGAQVWRRLYEQTLEDYANDEHAHPDADNNDNESTKKSLPQLCHTCHIARPPRSKHDRFTESCVLVFDHHCPFVGNTVGLYNYPYFYAFCFFTAMYLCVGHSVMLYVYCQRRKQQHGPAGVSMSVWLVGIFLSLHGLFALAMWLYHTKLLAENLTTNESVNTHKYKYLWRTTTGSNASSSTTTSAAAASRKTFYNPFNRGWLVNFQQRLLRPNEESFLLEEQFVGLLNNNTTNPDSHQYHHHSGTTSRMEQV